MADQLEFVEDFPQIVPDPPRSLVQFSVKWKVENLGDQDSPEAEVRVDVIDGNGGVVLTSIGRNVVQLTPGQTDEDTVDVGAVSSGNYTVEVVVDGQKAIIPITVL
ncbi:CARDB domain-containing protein [Streptomyces sp. NPDC048057]|uniref:CARDB domain-containing protein n=1 Tax=Streptomyces sp. NPDC048057 TaxID=3155628 RepID=UPI0033FE6EDD